MDTEEGRSKKIRKKKVRKVRTPSVLSNEDFDWDALKMRGETSPRHKEYEAMYDETLSTIAVDEVVQGTVIQMTSRSSDKHWLQI